MTIEGDMIEIEHLGGQTIMGKVGIIARTRFQVYIRGLPYWIPLKSSKTRRRGKMSAGMFQWFVSESTMKEIEG